MSTVKNVVVKFPPPKNRICVPPLNKKRASRRTVSCTIHLSESTPHVLGVSKVAKNGDLHLLFTGKY